MNSREIKNCLFCGKDVIENLWTNRSVHHWRCSDCGTAIVSDLTPPKLAKRSEEERIYLSFYSRRMSRAGKPLDIHLGNLESTIEDALRLKPRGVLEARNRVLSYLGSLSDSIGFLIKLDPFCYLDLALRIHEFDHLMGHLREAGLIEKEHGKFKLTVAGLTEYEKITTSNLSSTRAFVAMSFARDCEDIFLKGIRPAVEKAGFVAYRVDQERHIENINNRIIAGIRESRFLVAEFTEHNSGVYFETGFAMGIGIPVIWICKKSEFGKAHFDTKPFNHILWEDYSGLEEELYWYIEANIKKF
jgi:hypothetical protein